MVTRCRLYHASNLLLAAAFVGCFIFFGVVALRPSSEQGARQEDWRGRSLARNVGLSSLILAPAKYSVTPSTSLSITPSVSETSSPSPLPVLIVLGWSEPPTFSATQQASLSTSVSQPPSASPSTVPQSDFPSLRPDTPLSPTSLQTDSPLNAAGAIPPTPAVMAEAMKDGGHAVSTSAPLQAPPITAASATFLLAVPPAVALTTGIFPQTVGAAEADGCLHVFIDLKSRSAAAARWLFEPAAFAATLKPEASIVTPSAFDVLFGPVARRRRTVCAFLFEPDSGYRESLTALQDSFNWNGWRTTFHRPGSDDSFRATTASNSAVAIVTWLHTHVTNRRLPPPLQSPAHAPSIPRGRPEVVLKLSADAVGGAQDVIAALIDSDALCSISALLFESSVLLPDNELRRVVSGAGCATTRVIVLPAAETIDAGVSGVSTGFLRQPQHSLPLWQHTRLKRARVAAIDDILLRETEPWGFLGTVAPSETPPAAAQWGVPSSKSNLAPGALTRVGAAVASHASTGHSAEGPALTHAARGVIAASTRASHAAAGLPHVNPLADPTDASRHHKKWHPAVHAAEAVVSVPNRAVSPPLPSGAPITAPAAVLHQKIAPATHHTVAEKTKVLPEQPRSGGTVHDRGLVGPVHVAGSVVAAAAQAASAVSGAPIPGYAPPAATPKPKLVHADHSVAKVPPLPPGHHALHQPVPVKPSASPTIGPLTKGLKPNQPAANAPHTKTPVPIPVGHHGTGIAKTAHEQLSTSHGKPAVSASTSHGLPALSRSLPPSIHSQPAVSRSQPASSHSHPLPSHSQPAHSHSHSAASRSQSVQSHSQPIVSQPAPQPRSSVAMANAHTALDAYATP